MSSNEKTITNKEKTENFEKCPQCGEQGKFNPPTEQDGRKMIVNFICPNGHKFSKVSELK